MSKIELHSVNKEVFEVFLRKNALTEVQGRYFHSYDYIDSDGEIHASMETSSYGAETVYQISDTNYENMEAVSLVGKLINNKLKL